MVLQRTESKNREYRIQGDIIAKHFDINAVDKPKISTILNELNTSFDQENSSLDYRAIPRTISGEWKAHLDKEPTTIEELATTEPAKPDEVFARLSKKDVSIQMFYFRSSVQVQFNAPYRANNSDVNVLIEDSRNIAEMMDSLVVTQKTLFNKNKLKHSGNPLLEGGGATGAHDFSNIPPHILVANPYRPGFQL
jgi:hypothetical protein